MPTATEGQREGERNGAGPVGLTLAMDLATRGIEVAVARTDQHVAWRGDAVLDNPADLAGKLLGKNLDLASV